MRARLELSIEVRQAVVMSVGVKASGYGAGDFARLDGSISAPCGDRW